MAFLSYLKDVLKPALAISENVTSGNIGMRVVECLQGVMQPKAWV